MAIFLILYLPFFHYYHLPISLRHRSTGHSPNLHWSNRSAYNSCLHIIIIAAEIPCQKHLFLSSNSRWDSCTVLYSLWIRGWVSSWGSNVYTMNLRISAPQALPMLIEAPSGENWLITLPSCHRSLQRFCRYQPTDVLCCPALLKCLIVVCPWYMYMYLLW